MASEDGRASDDDDVDDDVNDQTAAAGFDLAADLSKMSEAERRKWDKSLQKWRMFVDFLLRHVAVVTYKYNCFERDDMTSFMMSLERAEILRSQTKLKKGDTARISCITAMKEAAELLVQNNCVAEANRIRKYVDLVARMRGLSTIAGGLLKALKRGKVKGVDQIKYCIDHWKGFCIRSFDYTELAMENIDISTLNDLDRHYLAWPAVIRTSINLAQKFLKKCCDSTGLDLLNTSDPLIMLRHMQSAEFIVAAKMEEMLFDKVVQESTSFGVLQSSQPLLSSTLATGRQLQSTTKKGWQLPPQNELDPALLKPIPDTSLLLGLPAEPPKEKKRKKGKKGGRKSKNSGAKSSTRHKSGKKRKK